MIIQGILACNQNHIIGVGDAIPWYHKGDLKRFFTLTKGHVLLMGAKTFIGMMNNYTKVDSEVLPGRQIIVVGKSRNGIPLEDSINELAKNKNILLTNVMTMEQGINAFHDLEIIQDILMSNIFNVKTLNPILFICGGASVYERYLNHASMIYLTIVDVQLSTIKTSYSDYVCLEPLTIKILEAYKTLDRAYLIGTERYEDINAEFYELKL